MTSVLDTIAAETSTMLSDPVRDTQTRIVEEQILPLHAEEFSVSRRRVDRAVVRVATVTHEREAVVEEQLTHEHVEVERVPIGREVEAMPPVRVEGDITIIPVVEEVVVVRRQLVLKEEVHLRKVRITEQHRETLVLRDQDVLITRTNPSDSDNTGL